MIIWGSKIKKAEVETGKFLCPKCLRVRTYKRIQVSKYFTLYFIPLIRTQVLGEYVECQTCFQAYKPEVLTVAPSTGSSVVANVPSGPASGKLSPGGWFLIVIALLFLGYLAYHARTPNTTIDTNTLVPSPTSTVKSNVATIPYNYEPNYVEPELPVEDFEIPYYEPKIEYTDNFQQSFEPMPSGCDGAYPDFCIPSPPPDLDCGDIGVHGFTVLWPDPHLFDMDGDGIGCE